MSFLLTPLGANSGSNPQATEEVAVNVEWKELAVIGSAGALGGIGAVLIDISQIGSIKFSSMLLGVPAYALLGMLAALVGVYFLFRPDVKGHSQHSLAMALVCGLFWSPVFDSAKAGLEQRQAEGQKVTLEKVSDRLDEAIASATEAANPSSLRKQSVQEIIGSLSTIRQIRQDTRNLSVASSADQMLRQHLVTLSEKPELKGKVAEIAKSSGLASPSTHAMGWPSSIDSWAVFTEEKNLQRNDNQLQLQVNPDLQIKGG